jgi:hypothetical protein
MKLTETELREIFFGEPKEIDFSKEELLHWTAVREAGHAVIARVLGLGPACGHVTIEPDEDSAGQGIIGDHYLILTIVANRSLKG